MCMRSDNDIVLKFLSHGWWVRWWGGGGGGGGGGGVWQEQRLHAITLPRDHANLHCTPSTYNRPLISVAHACMQTYLNYCFQLPQSPSHSEAETLPQPTARLRLLVR